MWISVGDKEADRVCPRVEDDDFLPSNDLANFVMGLDN
jgi:hypothetical protein